MGCKRTDCIEKPLSALFERLGSLIGSHPVLFLLLPLLLSALLGGGFAFLKDREDNDIERQFTPQKGPSKAARDFVRENFPVDDSTFSSQRLYTKGNFASVIALSKNNSNILMRDAIEDVIALNSKILGIAVDQGKLSFSDLCAKAEGQCVSNDILDIFHSDVNGTDETANITFPVHTHGSRQIFLGSVLGGISTDDATGVVTCARAVRLFYYLGSQESAAEVTKVWLREFKRLMSTETESKHIEVTYYTSKSKQEEIENHTRDGFPLFIITYAIAITFSVISCLRWDSVRNKVWVAVMGVISIGLAVLSSFGLMLYLGVPFVITVANSPFLILGIGLNNMFIMVSNWQHTKVTDSVPTRMAHTYREAAMSITITSLTDVVKFFIGVTSYFPSVQSFCLYTGTSVVFCYVYSITFFGAILALNGRREAGNRHWLTCVKLPTRTADLERSSEMLGICCVGGDYDTYTEKEKTHPVSNFFKSYYGPCLVKPWSKGIVMLLYVAYLAASVYGCFQIEQGIELYDLSEDNSHVTMYHRKVKEFFSNYGPNVMVVVTEEFPYWDETERSELQACMEDFKKVQFVDEVLYTSWLDSYLESSYGQNNRSNSSLDDKDVFLENLPSFLKSSPYLRQDVNLAEDSVRASRFFVQTVHITDAGAEIEMFKGLKDVADRCAAAAAPLLTYHPAFIFYDQYDVLVSSSVKNVGVITAVMFVVSLLLIPNPLCSLWVACSIGSVIVGVKGFMALWDVSLDSISMIIFSMCIGFTVDFSAHVAYAFVSSEKPGPDERVVEALSDLGYPVLQGGLATVLGVAVLSTSEFHIFRTFFKIMFLVMVIGMVHGLAFVPVILTLFTRSSDEEKRKQTVFSIH